ncbi:MAG: diacylglycerol kinase family protein [Clostridia bacterium]|nr:diacylglycerol kinase family protein [Clostridia bacterium]
MDMTYLLYNPLANNGGAEAAAKALSLMGEVKYTDIRKVGDFWAYLGGKDPTDRIIVAGGDGTLHHLVNALGGAVPAHPLYYYPCGSGNDFAKDIPNEQKKDGLILLNPYLCHLPQVEVNGLRRYFINSVGFGIDGYCCEEGSRLRKTTDKPIRYSSIAIKGLLLFFRPRNATVTVDGEEYYFPKAWLAPTMKGRYYGGGMMPTPKQDRLDPTYDVSFMTVYKTGRLFALSLFPSLFKGEHIYHKRVKVLKGQEISVSFDKPCTLEVDGETLCEVSSYKVIARPKEKKR